MPSIRKRNPFVVWLLGWVTVGIYYLVWMFQIMEELNIIGGREVFDRRKKLNTVITIFLPFSLCLALATIGMYAKSVFVFSALVILGWILAMVWIVFFVRTLLQISRQIAVVEVAQSSPSKISTGVTAILLIFLYLSMPYIQIHMNGIIENSTSDLGQTPAN